MKKKSRFTLKTVPKEGEERDETKRMATKSETPTHSRPSTPTRASRPSTFPHIDNASSNQQILDKLQSVFEVNNQMLQGLLAAFPLAVAAGKKASLPSNGHVQSAQLQGQVQSQAQAQAQVQAQAQAQAQMQALMVSHEQLSPTTPQETPPPPMTMGGVGGAGYGDTDYSKLNFLFGEMKKEMETMLRGDSSVEVN